MQEHKSLEFHGDTTGGVQTPLYQIWAQIVQRCFNPNHPKFKNYGQRGIDMDPRWRESFLTFKREVPRRPNRKCSIERIDNNKGYWPDNIRWEPAKIQNRNRRNTRILIFEDRKISLPALAEKVGMNRKRLQARLDAGMSVEEAVSKPLKKGAYKGFDFRGTHYASLVEAAKAYGIAYETVRSRFYNKKWSIEESLTTPVDMDRANRR